jgi:3-hydroxybutyryl-CoA dehydrogenase
MKHLAVIGAGTMGRGIAYVAALADFLVHLQDVNEPSLDKAKEYIEKEMREVQIGVTLTP